MSLPDLVYYAFWWSIGLAIVALLVIPFASFLFTIVVSAVALQIGLIVAICGYLVGIPWAIYRRVVDGEWPDGG